MEGLTITLPHVFVIAGLLMLLTELLVGIQTGFDLVLIGSVLILSGLVGILTGSTAIALILATVLSVVYIAVGRRYVRGRVIGAVATNKTNIDKLVGASGVVIRPITPDAAGMVRINDEDWRATAQEILYERDPVVVDAIEGVTLIVRKLAK